MDKLSVWSWCKSKGRETSYSFPFGAVKQLMDVFPHIGHEMAIIFPKGSGLKWCSNTEITSTYLNFLSFVSMTLLFFSCFCPSVFCRTGARCSCSWAHSGRRSQCDLHCLGVSAGRTPSPSCDLRWQRASIRHSVICTQVFRRRRVRFQDLHQSCVGLYALLS